MPTSGIPRRLRSVTTRRSALRAHATAEGEAVHQHQHRFAVTVDGQVEGAYSSTKRSHAASPASCRAASGYRHRRKTLGPAPRSTTARTCGSRAHCSRWWRRLRTMSRVRALRPAGAVQCQVATGCGPRPIHGRWPRCSVRSHCLLPALLLIFQVKSGFAGGSSDPCMRICLVQSTNLQGNLHLRACQCCHSSKVCVRWPVDPGRLHDLHMIMPSVSRAEHLDSVRAASPAS